MRFSCILAGLSVLIAPSLHAAPDVALVKTVNNATPGPNESVEFTISARNAGTDAAISVRVNDLLPQGIAIPDGMAAAPSSGSYDPDTGDWSIGDLQPDAAQSLIIPATITTTTPPPCLVNAATTMHQGDTNDSNDRDVAALRRSDTERCTDLATSFFGRVTEPLFCGENRSVSITVRVRNHGPDAARNVDINLSQAPAVLPGLRFNSSLCASPGGTACRISELPKGLTVLLITTDVFANTSMRSTQLSATITSSDFDYDTSNNPFSVGLNIEPFSACTPIDVPYAGPGCFIATAAYGSPLHTNVDALRRFRNRYLATNAPGQTLMRFYYRHSPAMAEVIAERDALRWITRMLLTPVVLFVVKPWLLLLAVILLAGVVIVLCNLACGRITSQPRPKPSSPRRA